MENNDLKVGDLVYVDAYGPHAYAYSSDIIEIKRDKPFRPMLYNFSNDLQYEVIYIDGDLVTLFDNENNVVDLSIDKLSKYKPFELEVN